MKKFSVLILAVVLVAAMYWLQRAIVKERAGYRVEEKILLVSDNPKVTKIAALGFDNLIADLGWIRSIQYFGGNFTSLNKPKKREGFVRLMETLVTLDPHFTAAWKFGGFAFNESVRDATLAIDFLKRGAKKNPDEWQLPFDAGFIHYYQLGNTQEAKKFFAQAYSRSELKEGRLARLRFNNRSPSAGRIELVRNPSPGPLGEISGLVGLIDHTIQSASPMIDGSTSVIYGKQTRTGDTTLFDIQVANNDQPVAMFDLHVEYDPQAYLFKSAAASDDLGYGTFEVKKLEEGRLAVLGDFTDPKCPSYVPRMAIEMDYAAGKFLSAWDQYIRYYHAAMQRGDEVSATIASDKLDTIYDNKCMEILNRAVQNYYNKFEKYPSTDMRELLESGVLKETVQDMIEEDPSQKDALQILTYGTGNLAHLLWERRKPEVEQLQPYILIIEETDGKKTPVIYPRNELVQRQNAILRGIQRVVQAFEEEKGRKPESLEEAKNTEWFKQNLPDGLPKDPLGGEYYLEEGEIKVRDLKY